MNNLDQGAVLEPQSLKALPVFLKSSVVCVARILFLNKDDGCGIHKTAKVIDVAMRVIARDTVTEPEDVRNAQILPQRLLDFFLAEPGIAHLCERVEEAFFRCKEEIEQA